MTHTPETAKQAMAAANEALDGVQAPSWIAVELEEGRWGVQWDDSGEAYPFIDAVCGGSDAETNARFIAYARQGVPALVAELAASVERERVLREALADAREDLMWSAYGAGTVRDGRWFHLFMSDGEWLARELGFNPKDGDYDDNAVREAIQVKARRALSGEAQKGDEP